MAWRDVPVPDTQESLQKVISKAVARDLELAVDPKDLTAAIKVAAEWYETLYGKSESEGYGTALGGRGNGHVGER
jgi:hypothetical protein